MYTVSKTYYQWGYTGIIVDSEKLMKTISYQWGLTHKINLPILK